MKRFRLKYPAYVILFLTSYSPLFVLLIIRQFKQNYLFLNYSDNSIKSFECLIKKFGLSILFIALMVFGFIGLKILLKNFKKNIDNGYLVRITEVENKSTESIAYISTYIVPFIFQDTENMFDLISILLIFCLIFFIYIKSNMIVINPILNIKYNIYQITYSKSSKLKRGFLITREQDLEEDIELKINTISKDIYYGHKTNPDQD